MTTDHDETEFRRYLLGELEDEKCAALEQEYFVRQDTFDRVWAVEHDLIDGYLSGRLSAHERDRFERYYLATPDHRNRVAVARELRAAALTERPLPAGRALNEWWTPAVRALRGWPPVWQMAAAAVVLLAAGGLWMAGSGGGPTTIASPPSAQAPAGGPDLAADKAPEEGRAAQQPPRAPVVVALSISPVSVRGTDQAASLIIAPGTDLVVLRLEGDTQGPPLGRGRAVVRTVTGNEVWRGLAVSERGSPAALARIEIPADRLTRDDYIVELFGADSNGLEVERYRYFLRVREQ